MNAVTQTPDIGDLVTVTFHGRQPVSSSTVYGRFVGVTRFRVTETITGEDTSVFSVREASGSDEAGESRLFAHVVNATPTPIRLRGIPEAGRNHLYTETDLWVAMDTGNKVLVPMTQGDLTHVESFIPLDEAKRETLAEIEALDAVLAAKVKRLMYRVERHGYHEGNADGWREASEEYDEQ